MHRKPLHWSVFLVWSLIACLLYGQDAATQVNQALIDKITNDYRSEKLLGKDDPEVNVNVLTLAGTLEMTRTDLLGQKVSDDEYWERVDNAVSPTIDRLDSTNETKQKMREFFEQQIAFLKARGKEQEDNNDALVLLIAGLRNVKDKNYRWKERLTGRGRGTTASGTSINVRAAAAPSVPNWYKQRTEHWKRHWEYRAKVRAWRWAVHRRY